MLRLMAIASGTRLESGSEKLFRNPQALDGRLALLDHRSKEEHKHRHGYQEDLDGQGVLACDGVDERSLPVAGTPDHQRRDQRERRARYRRAEAERGPHEKGNRQVEQCGKSAGVRERGIKRQDAHGREAGEQDCGFEHASLLGLPQSLGACRPCDRDGHEHERGQRIGKDTGLPQRPELRLSPADESDERCIQEGGKDRGGRRCAAHDGHAVYGLEARGLTCQVPDQSRSDQGLGHVADIPAQHHRYRNALLRFGEQMRRQHGEQQHPPPTRRCDEQRAEHDGVRWPQHCQRERRERERKADFRAHEVQDGDYEREEERAVQRRIASRDRATRLARPSTKHCQTGH
jgi:hypothetical protein